MRRVGIGPVRPGQGLARPGPGPWKVWPVPFGLAARQAPAGGPLSRLDAKQPAGPPPPPPLPPLSAQPKNAGLGQCGSPGPGVCQARSRLRPHKPWQGHRPARLRPRRPGPPRPAGPGGTHPPIHAERARQQDHGVAPLHTPAAKFKDCQHIPHKTPKVESRIFHHAQGSRTTGWPRSTLLPRPRNRGSGGRRRGPAAAAAEVRSALVQARKHHARRTDSDTASPDRFKYCDCVAGLTRASTVVPTRIPPCRTDSDIIPLQRLGSRPVAGIAGRGSSCRSDSDTASPD